MSKEMEYELTYLAKYLPAEIEGLAGEYVRDVYVPETVQHAHLRLRQRGETYVITKKVPAAGTDSSEQTEETIPLEKEEYEALAACSRKVVAKWRYKVMIAGHMAEVDVFDEQLKGLIEIDFEFASREEKAAFVPPEVCFADVTQEEAFAGGYLSGKSYEDIEPVLKKYGYNKVEVSDEI